MFKHAIKSFPLSARLSAQAFCLSVCVCVCVSTFKGKQREASARAHQREAIGLSHTAFASLVVLNSCRHVHLASSLQTPAKGGRAFLMSLRLSGISGLPFDSTFFFFFFLTALLLFCLFLLSYLSTFGPFSCPRMLSRNVF